MPQHPPYLRWVAYHLLWLMFIAPHVYAIPNADPTIQDMLAQVDAQRWYDTVAELVENEDLDQPGHFFHSRYSLRVQESVQLDGGARPDAACDNAAEYIARKFESYGLPVEFDSFSHRRLSLGGGITGDYVMRNVIATLPGRGPHSSRTYLVTAHYDSIASKTEGWEQNWRTLPAPGATDNASGVAEMLEMARILSQYRFDFTIQFIAFSGEELGLFGSKHYAEKIASRTDQIAGVINLDQLGHDPDGQLDIHVVADPQSTWLMHAFETTHQVYNIDVELVSVIADDFVYSDHAPFWQVGVSGVMVAGESSFEGPEWPEYTHSDEDTLDKLSLPLGERAIRLALATLAELSDPLDTASPDLPDVVLTSLEAPQTMLQGASVSITVTFTNASTVPVEVPLLVQLIQPNGRLEILTEQEFALQPQETHVLQASFVASSWGIYQIQATLNPKSTLFEADFGNNSLQHILAVTGSLQLAGTTLYPNPLRRPEDNTRVYLYYELSADANVEVQIYSIMGELIHELTASIGDEGGRLGPNKLMIWNGNNKSGRRVTPGIYFCLVRATGEDGAKVHRTLKLAVQ